jgi:phosphosulfolactate synthase
MNSLLSNLPERPEKPRDIGVTMVMDKGIGFRQAEDLVMSAGHLIDYIKLGFGTSLFTHGVKEKVSLYKKHGIDVFVGGTLFEAFVYRNQIDNYRVWIEKIGCNAVEISDGSMDMVHEMKCNLIRQFSTDYIVLSEVGNKEADKLISPSRWVEMTENELEAGSRLVIAEARESGTVGIYNRGGEADTDLIDQLLAKVSPDKIMWEAPQKTQQVWFIKKLGHNVNLGNISPTEIIPLETLRTGLRGDTFMTFSSH